MIVVSRASLAVHSDVKTVAEISAILDLEPDQSGDIDDLTPSGRAGRDVAPDRLRYQRTFWSLTDHDDGTTPDQSGFAALRSLVRRVRPHAEELGSLRIGGETVLWWSGDSDSVQGGFVLAADLLGDLAALRCDLYGTTYLDEGAGESRS